ncbi:MAG: DUF4255 domain-containing protein [Pseudomonadales bacterium]|nr:DUF4255 domain-containing protein [Pseudomonadales bacterium]
MIGDIAYFLKDKLSTYLDQGLDDTGATEEQVVFVGSDKTDAINFKLGSISMMLINVEEENTLREANPYIRRDSEGNAFHASSTIRLNLSILFVSRYKDYRQSLNRLSQVIQYFQSHRVFNQDDQSGLPVGVDRLILEMTTLPFAQQNEVWSSLRSAYLPSVLYKVGVLALVAEPKESIPLIKETAISIADIS